MKKILLGLSIIACSASLLSAQTINTVAGNSIMGYSGDGGQATAAELNTPYCVAFDAAGNIYFTDDFNFVVRKITTSGVVSTVVGVGGFNGYSGDGGPATAAELNFPFGIAFDATGNMYIGDTYNNAIRKVDLSGIITTVAGNGTSAYSGDGGPATDAELQLPMGVAFDKNNNLYIADQTNNVIREVNSSGIISTVAGNGQSGFFGDGGQATIAELNAPPGLAFDASGKMYIADEFNRVIRKIDNTGKITTVAGKHGFQGYTGDGGPATAAELYAPFSVAFDATGNMYIADGNTAIRMVDLSNVMHTFAGNAFQGYSGDGGPPTAAEINNPSCAVFDAVGNMWICDEGNYVIREITEIPTGISSARQGTDVVSVYPNPSNGAFTFQVDNEKLKMNCVVEIYNIMGEKVYATAFSTVNFQLSINQPSGIYLYRIITETGNIVSTGKLVIDK